MKRHFLMLSILAAGTIMTSCNEIINENEIAVENQTATSDNSYYLTRTFAKPDDSKELNGTPQDNLKALFTATGPSIINSLGSLVITDEQYEEIKKFTDNLVASKTTEKGKYDAICSWVHTNVKYNNPDNNPQNKPYGNDPYEVFKNKIAVCQGYSNLMVVMCMTQEIPAVVINGFLVYGSDLGHAWMYGCPGGTWYVSDPTNGTKSWPMKNTEQYTNLKPMQADVDIFKDDYAIYNYVDGRLNVREVTAKSDILVVPYSVGGFVINSFNPEKLPEEIAEVYLGQNIATIGDSDNMNLKTKNSGRNLHAMHVAEENPALMSHEGIIYRKNGDNPQICYIPAKMTQINMLPMETVEKNTIANHKSVKVIYFPEGTKKLEAYAIEKCSLLEQVYVPEDAVLDKNAISCTQEVEVLRGIPNGIKPVTMD